MSEVCHEAVQYEEPCDLRVNGNLPADAFDELCDSSFQTLGEFLFYRSQDHVGFKSELPLQAFTINKSQSHLVLHLSCTRK